MTGVIAPTPDGKTSSAAMWKLTDDALPLALLFVALGVGVFIIPAQNDTWWHLHSGRAMWEARELLMIERFSFASKAQPLDNHWWLTQLGFFATYQAGGAVLLTIAAGACAFLAVCGSFALMRASLEARLLLLVALILCTAPEWSIRPQVVSLLLLVIMAHLIVRDRLWWLPVVCLFWGNAHAMVVFGIVMAGSLVLDAIAFERARLPRAVAVLALCIAAPMVSPLGWHYWPRVLATVSTSRALQLQEYRTPVELGDLPFWMLLIALIGVAIRERQRLTALPSGRRAILIGAFVLALAALSAARNVAFFAVLAAPAVSALLPETRPRRTKAVTWPAYVMLGIEALVALAFVGARWVDGGRALGWRPIEPSAIEAVRNCPGRVFNTLEDGGPLMWALHDRPIFVDSRMEAYPQQLLARSREADLDGRYEELFTEFDIRCALVPTGSVLDTRLRSDQTMAVRHSDASRTVYEKKP